MFNLAVIQARLSSVRLPNKSIRRINKRLLIEHVISRVAMSKTIDAISLIIPTEDREIFIEKFKEQGINNIWYSQKLVITDGDKENVLLRCLGAYYNFIQASAIIRICGDCPLIDPAIIDHAVNEYYISPRNFYMVSNVKYVQSGFDVEVFHPMLLEQIKGTEDKEEQEHFTLALYRRFKENIFNLRSYERCNEKFSVDTQEDFEFVSSIIQYFENQQILFYSYQDIIEAYNAGRIRRNSNKE